MKEKRDKYGRNLEKTRVGSLSVTVASMSPNVWTGDLRSCQTRDDMFDIYLNGRRDLLVVPRGFAIPAGLDGSWKRKKRAVRSVSDVIRQDVQQRGYHRRSLISNRSKTSVETSSRA